jgi:NAD(P)-dependent dehydrogenase (short-subunit alcohol dehydrogenase family)
MNKTILITGVSSGIGKVTGEYFKANGWTVIGTSRTAQPNVYALDVTNVADCQRVIDQIVQEHGQIDVVLNNAGYGLYGAFEQCDDQDVRKQYEVNVFGTMNICRAILPHMRQWQAGTIVNISSIGGKFVVPYYGVYNSTKFAIEGFSEGLWHEVKPFGIRVKVVEPGAINTGFYDRSKQEGKQMNIDPVYKAMTDKLWPQYAAAGKKGADPMVVAKVIYKAATSNNSRLRYAAARDAHINIAAMKILPHQIGLWLASKFTVER